MTQEAYESYRAYAEERQKDWGHFMEQQVKALMEMNNAQRAEHIRYLNERVKSFSL